MNTLTITTVMGAACMAATPVWAGDSYLSGYDSGHGGYSRGGDYLSGYDGSHGYSRSGQYLSGYSHGGYSRGYGHGSGYIRNFTSTQWGGVGNFIDSPHDAEYARLRKARIQQATQNAWYDKNPPCGMYGRVPTRCKGGE